MPIQTSSIKRSIPWSMAAARALLGPIMLLGQRAGWNGLTLATLILTGLLSDIFDGVLARRWRCDTPAVRLFDSLADIAFYLGCAAALWLHRPHLITAFALPIATVLSLEAIAITAALLKFGKPPSYHSWLAKTFGLALAPTLIASFLAPPSSPLLTTLWWLTAALGAASNLEGLTMTLLLPTWRQDVKTIGIARRLRGLAQHKQSIQKRRESPTQAPYSQSLAK